MFTSENITIVSSDTLSLPKTTISLTISDLENEIKKIKYTKMNNSVLTFVNIIRFYILFELIFKRT